MKVVMLEAPSELIEERRRKGHDRFDEVWEGILHMVPSPTPWHQRLGTKLLVTIEPVAERLGLIAIYETDLHRPGSEGRDYRQPDLLVYRPEHEKNRRVEGAELIFELLSPDDESREKLDFYAALGVKEAFLIEPDARTIELYLLRNGKLLPATSADGGFRSEVLGITFQTIEGPKLLVRWKGGEVRI